MNPNTDRLWTAVLSAAAVVVAAALSVLAWAVWQSLEPAGVRVLDASEPQILVQQDRGDDGFPVVQWGDSFVAEAVICNVSDRPVALSGLMQLEFEIPSGLDPIVVFENGSELLVPGCTHWRVDPVGDCPRVADECRQAFSNVLHRDDAVAEAVEALLEDGISPVVQLVGVMNPVDDSALSERWFTEQFRIVP